MSDKKRTLQDVQQELTKTLFEIGVHTAEKRSLESMILNHDENIHTRCAKVRELKEEADALRSKIKDEMASVIQNGRA